MFNTRTTTLPPVGATDPSVDEMPPPRITNVRCECMACGSHAIAQAGHATLSGMCSVCGCYRLAPLDRR